MNSRKKKALAKAESAALAASPNEQALTSAYRIRMNRLLGHTGQNLITTLKCDEPGCEEAVVCHGSPLEADDLGRYLGWSVGEQDFCPKHRAPAPVAPKQLPAKKTSKKPAKKASKKAPKKLAPKPPEPKALPPKPSPKKPSKKRAQ
jgi:hypothetical protein